MTSLSKTDCDASTTLITDRGFLWADGSDNGLYNQVLPPNNSTMDCVRHSKPAWKTARSRHDGGGNILRAASRAASGVRFVHDSMHSTPNLAGARHQSDRDSVGDF